jgi:hypothetical protein
VKVSSQHQALKSLRIHINICLLLLIFHPFWSHSQGFNIELTQPTGAFASLTIERLKGDTVMILPLNVDLGMNGLGFSSLLISPGGATLRQQSFIDSNSFIYPGSSNSMDKLGYSNFILGGNTRIGNVIRGALIALNEIGDTLWVRQYGNPAINSTVLYQATTTRNGDIVGVGSHTISNQRNDGWLIKTDSLGNKLWERIYSTSIGTQEFLYSVQETYDGGFLLGGQEQENPNNPNTRNYDPIIIKTDSAGNQQWRFRYDTPEDDPYNYCIQTYDSNYVCAGSYTYLIPPGFSLGRAALFKVNRSGQLIWRKEYGPIKNNHGFYMVKQLEDSSLIAVGRRLETQDKTVGIMVKTKANGDSIFVHDYELDVSKPFNENRLHDVVQLSDGGFMACGEVIHTPAIPNRQNPWLIRTDSNGCVISNCLVGVDEVIKEKAQIQVYPNPSKGQFQIQGLDENPLKFQLFDLQGRMLQLYEPKASQWALPEAKGIYLLRIQLASGEWVQEKVMRMGD